MKFQTRREKQDLAEEQCGSWETVPELRSDFVSRMKPQNARSNTAFFEGE